MSEHEFSLICWSDHPTIVFGDEEYTVLDFNLENQLVRIADEEGDFWVSCKLIEIQN
jgi:hypothetical protein